MKTVGDTLFYTTFILSIISLCLPKCECNFVIHPSNSTAIATTTASLECNSDTGDEILWFKKGIGSAEDIEINDGYKSRYEIQDDSSKSSLSITSSTEEDSGEFYCGSTKSDNPQNTAALHVIVVTSTWFPSCRQYPERVASGANVKIACTSSANDLGTTLPELKWTLDNELISNSSPFQNKTHSINSYTSIVNKDDHGKRFVCHASLSSGYLHNPPMCDLTLNVDQNTEVLNDWRHGNNNIVPYIIVAVLSLIAIILFVIVIVFMFRFRECKYCKENVPQPQQVLDMSAIEDGVGVPMTLLTDQSSDDEPVGSSKSKKRKTKPKEPAQTKPSVDNVKHTAQGRKFEEAKMNFDYNFQKPDRKETVNKTKNINLKMKHSKERNTPVERAAVKQSKITKNQTENTTESARKQPTTAHGRPRSMRNTKSKESIDKVNNLGNLSEPTRPISKQSLSKRTTDSQATSDTVVYADLNFARSLGLNITKDEHL
ncbi:uncharacterized protein LOC117112863 [Anneissia japonica]|uniref:uncharacterized protein LOC117112863 n=1 Tax=Anneissia japonica TaxID=1529436 RepID=UPI001425591B|nr:uncharacterized protein LOC117112863 [Anneissia japonica]XP_033111944.1 uncharacterized protein LOC117112863 [Anneissia japonica]